MKKIAIILAAVLLAGCSDTNGARHALNTAGYTEVRIDGYAFFGCGKDDGYHTKFSAKGPTGVPVTGVVCSGVLKGSTIRLD